MTPKRRLIYEASPITLVHNDTAGCWTLLKVFSAKPGTRRRDRLIRTVQMRSVEFSSGGPMTFTEKYLHRLPSTEIARRLESAGVEFQEGGMAGNTKPTVLSTCQIARTTMAGCCEIHNATVEDSAIIQSRLETTDVTRSKLAYCRLTFTNASNSTISGLRSHEGGTINRSTLDFRSPLQLDLSKQSIIDARVEAVPSILQLSVVGAHHAVMTVYWGERGGLPQILFSRGCFTGNARELLANLNDQINDRIVVAKRAIDYGTLVPAAIRTLCTRARNYTLWPRSPYPSRVIKSAIHREECNAQAVEAWAKKQLK